MQGIHLSRIADSFKGAYAKLSHQILEGFEANERLFFVCYDYISWWVSLKLESSFPPPLDTGSILVNFCFLWIERFI